MVNKKTQPKRKAIVPITINKSNLIINAVGHPSALAQKIFNMSLRYIDIDKKHTPAQLAKLQEIENKTGVDYSTGIVSKFKQADFLRLIPGKTTRWYEIRSYMFSKDKGLASEYIVSIPNSKGVSTGFTALITGAYYDEETRDIYIKFQDSEVMRRELMTLSNYTQLTLNIEAQFRSAYTIRIYEILDSYIGLEVWKGRQNHKKKSNVYEYQIGTERLKWLIGAAFVKDKVPGVDTRQLIKIQDIIGKKIDECKDDEDYDNIYTEYQEYISSFAWPHFKKTVLETAIKEMNKISDQTGKEYSYEPVKSGKRYKYVIFRIKDLSYEEVSEESGEGFETTVIVDKKKEEAISKIRSILDKKRIFSEQVTDSECYNLATYVDFDYDRFSDVYDTMIEYAMTQESVSNVTGLLRTMIKSNAMSNKGKKKITFTDQLDERTSAVEISVEKAKRIIRDHDYTSSDMDDDEKEFIEKHKKLICVSCSIPPSKATNIDLDTVCGLLKRTDEVAKQFMSDETGQGTMIFD